MVHVYIYTFVLVGATRENENLLPSLKALESLTFHLTLAERRVSSIKWPVG